MGGENIGQISADKHLGNRWRVLIAMIPTAPLRRIHRRTPVGLWTISIDSSQTPLSAEQNIDVWVQRDDDPTQLGTGGQQSNLVDLTRPKAPRPLDDAPLSVVRGYGCLNGIGTAPSVMRVAGYVEASGRPARYSGSSSLNVGGDGAFVMGPEIPGLSAVSDQGRFRPGLPSIGVLSGSGARIVGTSAAAATATRVLARNIAAETDPLAEFDDVAGEDPPADANTAIKLARSGRYRAKSICDELLRRQV